MRFVFSPISLKELTTFPIFAKISTSLKIYLKIDVIKEKPFFFSFLLEIESISTVIFSFVLSPFKLTNPLSNEVRLVFLVIFV